MKKLVGAFFCLVFLLCTVSAQAQSCSGLTEALDDPSLTWQTGGNSTIDWFCQVDESVAGGSAAQTDTESCDNGTRWLETDVTIDKTQVVSFYWKMSPNPYGWLRFYINDQEQTSINGGWTESQEWAQQDFMLMPGTHTLTWEYTSSTCSPSAEGSAWVDNVKIVDQYAFEILKHYLAKYAVPRIADPQFVKNRVAKTTADECYNGDGAEPDENGNCAAGIPKKNQAYVWGMARSGNVWFGTGANMFCLSVGGMAGIGTGSLPTSETEDMVCEYNQADNPFGVLGDWRSPEIFEYDPDTMMLIDRTPLALVANPTFGIRAAGALNGVVLLGGPSLDYASSVNLFAFDSDTGAYLGMDVMNAYNNIRSLVVYDGVLYAGMSAAADNTGRILRWVGDSNSPFEWETVGKITGPGIAYMTVHENRLALSTGVVPGLTEPAGIYISPEVPEGGLTGADNDTWVRIWGAEDYEPDPFVRAAYFGGGLASLDGTLYWGSMHVPLMSTLLVTMAEQQGYIDLSGLDNESDDNDFLTTFLGTTRAISVFSATIEASQATVELLYGDEYLPVYDPAARSYTIAEDAMHQNNMPNPEPKWGPSGIGNFFNTYTWTMDTGFADYTTRGGVLLGTFDWSGIVRDSIGSMLAGMGGDAELALTLIVTAFDEIMALYADYGADMYVIRSADEPFILDSSDGQGNPFNYGIRTMLMPDTTPDSPAPADGPALVDESMCDLGYLGMANAFNLAEEGGWELLQMYPRPELALVIPALQQEVLGMVVLQAEDLSACPLSSVEFVLTNVVDQSMVYTASYNAASGLWEYELDSSQLVNGIYYAQAQGVDAGGNVAETHTEVFMIVNDCLAASECNDGLFCNGEELCLAGVCEPAFEAPCGEEEVCIEDRNRCVPRECWQDSDCDDGLFCTGAETCEDGLCEQEQSCTSLELCVEDTQSCVPKDCLRNSDCDDNLFCTGEELCVGGMCQAGTEPCEGEGVCAENTETCVECLVKSDCGFGYLCEEEVNVCSVQCPLIIATKKDKPILVKPGKDKKVKLLITGGEGFDPDGVFDAGPFTYKKRKYSEKKGVLKIWLTIPAGLAPNTYEVGLGECLGEVTFGLKD